MTTIVDLNEVEEFYQPNGWVARKGAGLRRTLYYLYKDGEVVADRLTESEAALLASAADMLCVLHLVEKYLDPDEPMRQRVKAVINQAEGRW